ncbi:MAG TPA: PfkB family carbohydrate kinase [Ktedonobacterales bacterium]|nr:PfkB family carbohydrate kinase [Ktedonobacterales bacterium]
MSEASAGLAPAPDFLVIGHVTKDLRPDGSFTIGGAATFAALTAQRLGLRAGIVTSASPDVLEQLPEALPGVAVAAVPASESTTFENSYENGHRRQYLRGRAEPLTPEAIPTPWRQARIVLLGPLAQEVAPECAAAFPGALLGASPQGWLRQWAADGLVSPTAWSAAVQVVPHLHALILSREDLIAHQQGNHQRELIEALLTDWASATPLLALTEGAQGATLYHAGKTRHFRAFPTTEVDPTGAGDVFAAAFLVQYAIGQDAAAAMRFANCAASFAVEQPGTAGIPTPEQVAARLRRSRTGD